MLVLDAHRCLPTPVFLRRNGREVSQRTLDDVVDRFPASPSLLTPVALHTSLVTESVEVEW